MDVCLARKAAVIAGKNEGVFPVLLDGAGAGNCSVYEVILGCFVLKSAVFFYYCVSAEVGV